MHTQHAGNSFSEAIGSLTLLSQLVVVDCHWELPISLYFSSITASNCYIIDYSKCAWGAYCANCHWELSISLYFSNITQSKIYRRGNVENDWNSSVVRRWQSNAIIGFLSLPMPEVPLSRCWPSSEMPVILCFKIIGIPIKANFISIN